MYSALLISYESNKTEYISLLSTQYHHQREKKGGVFQAVQLSRLPHSHCVGYTTLHKEERSINLPIPSLY